jgi:hypothetical protein
LEGESLEKARDNWARAKVLSDFARADQAFMLRPEVSLRIRILEAGILSADLLRRDWSAKIKASPQEIAEFLAAHPEYDLAKKKEKAEMVLQRVRAGEDIAALAAEFSEDRTTKSKGGLYENVGAGEIWPEIDNAVLTLKPGEVAASLIETNTGFHVVKLQNKQTKKGKDGKETMTYSIRHILFQKSFEDPANNNPAIPSPFLKPEEIAKAQIEKEKRDKFVAGICELNPITLPEDFTVGLPAEADAGLRKS